MAAQATVSEAGLGLRASGRKICGTRICRVGASGTGTNMGEEHGAVSTDMPCARMPGCALQLLLVYDTAHRHNDTVMNFVDLPRPCNAARMPTTSGLLACRCHDRPSQQHVTVALNVRGSSYTFCDIGQLIGVFLHVLLGL
eukprot:358486-Chlamydomonas_euryale.AAC.12